MLLVQEVETIVIGSSGTLRNLIPRSFGIVGIDTINCGPYFEIAQAEFAE
jgi:hypothetical protein